MALIFTQLLRLPFLDYSVTVKIMTSLWSIETNTTLKKKEKTM